VAGRGDPKRLNADPELELELEVCRHYRLPHSQFLGWSDDDRAKAIWSHVRARQTCARCGTRDEEWDPQRGGHRRAYTAEAHVCRGCEAVEARSAGLTDEDRTGGVHVALKKRGPDAES
jgi:hypothetical protein